VSHHSGVAPRAEAEVLAFEQEIHPVSETHQHRNSSVSSECNASTSASLQDIVISFGWMRKFQFVSDPVSRGAEPVLPARFTSLRDPDTLGGAVFRHW
jgi:hypothetical protein